MKILAARSFRAYMSWVVKLNKGMGVECFFGVVDKKQAIQVKYSFRKNKKKGR